MIVAEKHTILGGKVHVYRRENSSVWQCSSYLEGRNRRVSTKEESLAKAKEFAEDWYLELRGKKARGETIDVIQREPMRMQAKRFVQKAQEKSLFSMRTQLVAENVKQRKQDIFGFEPIEDEYDPESFME